MSGDLGTLSVAAVSIGFVHCLCGPDHYVPFVAMSRVGLWSLRKTLPVTVLCGIGHVAGSVALGFVGIAMGLIVFQLKMAEYARSNVASWLLVTFGLAYFVWGIVHGIRHRHATSASDEVPDGHSHVAAKRYRPEKLTPWILFTIFLFGPCEPLIPLLMYPAAEANLWSVVFVTALFGLTTLLTMTALVTLIYLGTSVVRFRRVHSYGHALAGLVVLLCGAATMFGM